MVSLLWLALETGANTDIAPLEVNIVTLNRSGILVGYLSVFYSKQCALRSDSFPCLDKNRLALHQNGGE
jgi:hypothetical protein